MGRDVYSSFNCRHQQEATGNRTNQKNMTSQKETHKMPGTNPQEMEVHKLSDNSNNQMIVFKKLSELQENTGTQRNEVRNKT